MSAARRVGCAVAAAAAAALSGLALAQDDAGWEDAYARVGEAPISRAAVDADVARGAPLPQVLQRHVSLEVLRQGLARNGVDPGAVSEEELSAAVEEATASLRAMGRDLEAVLKQAGQTRAQFRESIRVPTAFRKFVRSGIRDEELRATFEADALRIAGEVRAMHVLVTIRADRDEVAARARAQELVAGLGASPTREAFAALAREASDDPMASLTDGDLDWFPARGNRVVPSAVAGAAFGRGDPGLVPGPIKSPRGFHLVYVTATRLPASATFERLGPALRDQAEQRRANELVAAWMEESPIEYAPDVPRPTPGR